MLRDETDELEIVSGNAFGADILGERYAKENDLKLAVFPARWDALGRKAGSIRNSQMIEYALEETPEVIAFWDSNSHGTRGMIVKAFGSKIECTIVDYKNNVIIKPEYMELER